jgi:hypothetical protein
MTESEAAERVRWVAILGALLDDPETGRKARLVAILVVLGLLLLLDRPPHWWVPAW